MCRLTDVNRSKRVLDITCGSGSFLVQAMVKELADCYRDKTEDEAKALQEIVKKEHILALLKKASIQDVFDKREILKRLAYKVFTST